MLLERTYQGNLTSDAERKKFFGEPRNTCKYNLIVFHYSANVVAGVHGLALTQKDCTNTENIETYILHSEKDRLKTILRISLQTLDQKVRDNNRNHFTLDFVEKSEMTFFYDDFLKPKAKLDTKTRVIYSAMFKSGAQDRFLIYDDLTLDLNKKEYSELKKLSRTPVKFLATFKLEKIK